MSNSNEAFDIIKAKHIAKHCYKKKHTNYWLTNRKINIQSKCLKVEKRDTLK